MSTREAVAELTVERVARAMDHVVLAPDRTFRDIEQACRDAVEYGLAAVCLPPYAVGYAAQRLRGTGVALCGAVGIPLGHGGLQAKCDEARSSIEAGAGEIDMVINLVAMKSGRYADVQAEVAAVRKLATGLILKVTLECCYLSDAEKVRAGRLALEAGADFLKTHTGFGRSGVRAHDVQLLKRVVAGTAAEVEAAGGLTQFKQVLAMLQAGAARIGSEAAIDVIRDFYKWESEQ